MTGLPDSLAIALWCVGSIWAVGLVAYFTDAGSEVVLATATFGITAAVSEFVVRRRSKR